jgi:hypothetical protein
MELVLKHLLKSKGESLEEILLFGIWNQNQYWKHGLEVGIATDKDKYSKRLQ